MQQEKEARVSKGMLEDYKFLATPPEQVSSVVVPGEEAHYHTENLRVSSALDKL